LAILRKEAIFLRFAPPDERVDDEADL